MHFRILDFGLDFRILHFGLDFGILDFALDFRILDFGLDFRISGFSGLPTSGMGTRKCEFPDIWTGGVRV